MSYSISAAVALIILSTGWFRAGVGFYNKREFTYCIDCLQRAVAADPLNYNAYQILARACIAVNRRDDAIEALKQSVKLDNPSDWQLLVELTAQEKAAKTAATAAAGGGGSEREQTNSRQAEQR